VLGDAIFKKQMNFAVRMCFVVLGGVIYYLVIGLVMWLRMPTDLLKLLTAAIVAIFLAVPYLREKSKNSFALAGKRGADRDA